MNAWRDLGMILDEMSAPLGQHRPAERTRRPLSVSALIRCALAAFVVTFTGWAIMSNEPSDPAPATGKSAGTGSAEAQSGRAAKQAAAEEPESVRIETPPPPTLRTVTIIDGTSGKRQEVVLPAPPPDEAEVEQRAAEKPKRGAVARRSIHNSP